MKLAHSCILCEKISPDLLCKECKEALLAYKEKYLREKEVEKLWGNVFTAALENDLKKAAMNHDK